MPTELGRMTARLMVPPVDGDHSASGAAPRGRARVRRPGRGGARRDPGDDGAEAGAGAGERRCQGGACPAAQRPTTEKDGSLAPGSRAASSVVTWPGPRCSRWRTHRARSTRACGRSAACRTRRCTRCSRRRRATCTGWPARGCSARSTRGGPSSRPISSCGSPGGCCSRPAARAAAVGLRADGHAGRRRAGGAATVAGGQSAGPREPRLAGPRRRPGAGSTPPATWLSSATAPHSAAIEIADGVVTARAPAGSVLAVWTGSEYQVTPVKRGSAVARLPGGTPASRRALVGAAVFTWRGDYRATGWLAAYSRAQDQDQNKDTERAVETSACNEARPQPAVKRACCLPHGPIWPGGY